jgi:hypothetical protein
MQVEENRRSLELHDPASETLSALLHGGYVAEGGRGSVGRGILLQHQGGAPDLVLYPDGSLHPVRVREASAGDFGFMGTSAKPKRSLGPRILRAVMWAFAFGLLTFSCALSITFWVAILPNS